MMSYKKIIIAVPILIFFAVSVFMIYNVNSVYPNAEEKAYREGDVTRYKGLKMTVGEVEIYTEDELIEEYADIDINGKLTTEGYIVEGEHISEGTYIIVNITLENDTDETITFGKLDDIYYWITEVGMTANSTFLRLFFEINPVIYSSFSAGDVQEMKLLYRMDERNISYEQLKQNDIKVVFSYYPTKEYLLYEGEK